MSTVQRYKHTKAAVYLLNYHFVWIARRRKAVLVGDVEQRTRELLEEGVERCEGEMISLQIMPDHVHLFASFPPDLSPRQLMHRIKGYSAKKLREEFPSLLKMPSMWTHSYFVSTAGNVSAETIQRYIEAQKKV